MIRTRATFEFAINWNWAQKNAEMTPLLKLASETLSNVLTSGMAASQMYSFIVTSVQSIATRSRKLLLVFQKFLTPVPKKFKSDKAISDFNAMIQRYM